MKRPNLNNYHTEHCFASDMIRYAEYLEVKSGYLEVKTGLLEKLVEQLTAKNKDFSDLVDTANSHLNDLEQENEDLKAAAKARDYETTTLITSLKDELNKFPPPIGEDC